MVYLLGMVMFYTYVKYIKLPKCMEILIYLAHSGPVLYTLVQTPSKHCKLAIADAVVLPIPEPCCVTEHKAAPGSSKQQVTKFGMSCLKSF